MPARMASLMWGWQLARIPVISVIRKCSPAFSVSDNSQLGTMLQLSIHRSSTNIVKWMDIAGLIRSGNKVLIV